MASFYSESIASLGAAPLHPGTYERIRFSMLDHYDEYTFLDGEPIGYKGQFSSIMRQVVSLKPDVLLFPAYSAIPLASAVDAFYEGIGGRLPAMDYIAADQSYAIQGGLGHPAVKGRFDGEVARLGDRYAGKTAAVLDHMYVSGGSLRVATALLQAAGIENAGTFSKYIQWYAGMGDDEKSPAMLDTLVVPQHEAFMRSIGASAAHRVGCVPAGSPHV